jgi:hypothetical protein
MNHDELKKQYEAEAKFNPEAWKNWQWWQDGYWVQVGTGGPAWLRLIAYRRDPSKPPFVVPTMCEQAMERVGEVNDFLAEQKEDFQATKLTPPSAEQIALIDEAARQEKTGEKQAWYWRWLDSSGKSTYNRCSGDVSYHPSTYHPHYATYCQWQQLVDAGEVAKGWWILETKHPSESTCIYGFVDKTIPWWIDRVYEIYKSYRHPDHSKPA